MWRDIARRAAGYGLKATLPAPYPLKELVLANQVALLGMREGWGQAYTMETYRLWFVQGHPAGSEPNLSASLIHAGQDPAQTIEQAKTPKIVQALVDETAICQKLGVFGAPSFVVGQEVFWGDDRLDDAISWAG
jgi:2-hydroxychromene-2-carboxylate isomerase